MTARQSTTAEAEAAELMTVAHLGLRGIVAGQYPRNHPRADVFAFLPGGARRADVQVKYRDSAAAYDVQIDALVGVDFVALYRANRGPSVGGRSALQVWVVPAAVAAPLLTGGRLKFSAVPDEYLHAWDLVEAFLKG